jgi:hypothetical protein
MLYDPGRDRTVIDTKVIAQAQTGDSLKRDRPEGVEACNQKQLKCHWELSDAGSLEMIWSLG